MNSPVITQFNFIILDSKSETPLYIQLIDEFIKAIQLGQLKNGYKLPGTRKLAEIFNLNRNTIVKSFDELAAQGWIEIKPNCGTYIINLNEITDQKIKANSELKFPHEANFKFNKSILLELATESNSHLLQINDGKPDFRLTELKTTSKYYSSILKRRNSDQKITSNQNLFFVKQLTNYINITRNFSINPSQILVCNNREMALQMIAKTLLKHEDYVAVSDFSYYKSNMIFQENYARIIPIESDELGIKTEILESICKRKQIRALYISTHNYPTTNTLNNQRRLEIKYLAKEYGFVIVEDDPSFDFYYSTRPTIPLTTNNFEGNIIYTSIFGEHLPPGFQKSFVIAPSDFIEEMKKHLYVYDSYVDPLMAQTLAEMISEGEISKILKKQRKIYKQKRDYFCNLLYQHFKNEIMIQIPKNGFAIWIEWNKSINLMQLKKDAEEFGLIIPQKILYQNNNKSGMRLGFGQFQEDEMNQIIKILKESYNKQKKLPSESF